MQGFAPGAECRAQGAQPHLATGLFSTGHWSPRPTATVGIGQPQMVSKPESYSGSFGGHCAGGRGPLVGGGYVCGGFKLSPPGEENAPGRAVTLSPHPLTGCA